MQIYKKFQVSYSKSTHFYVTDHLFCQLQQHLSKSCYKFTPKISAKHFHLLDKYLSEFALKCRSSWSEWLLASLKHTISIYIHTFTTAAKHQFSCTAWVNASSDCWANSCERNTKLSCLQWKYLRYTINNKPLKKKQ